MKASWKARIRDFISRDNPVLNYLRGVPFGDTLMWWPHVLNLEDRFDRQPGVAYPRCTDGRNACPPEGCQGVYGYRRLLRALNNPASPYHADCVKWVGDSIDPRWFDPSLVRFEDPVLRLKLRLEGKPLRRGMRQVQYHQMRG